jgi:hypothetical protein
VADRVEWLPDLEAELRTLGREIDVPAAPDLTADVRARLERPALRRRPSWWRGWRVAVPIVLALLGLLLATPQGRAVITEVFRFAGIELRQESVRLPSPRISPSLPGERRMSLQQARRQVTFPILVPAALGAPDEVVVSDGGRVVSLAYRRTPYGEVRMDEFDGHLNPVYFHKFVHAENVAQVDVTGRPGLWITGPHDIFYVRRDGIEDTASARLTTGNTLVWDTGKVAIRLEGGFGKDQALAVARSVRS